MTARWWWLGMASAVALWRPAMAQERDLRAELGARGAPATYVASVMAEVEAARADGLPTGPMADKALEGWSKRVAEPRVVAALVQMRSRLGAGRELLVRLGQVPPSDPLVTGAAEALGRGLSGEEVGLVVQGAPGVDAAAAGLMVAAALHAQGLDRAAAVRAVRDAYAHGTDPAQLFELPSALADLTAHGMAMGDVARRIMQGGGLPLPPMAGSGQGAGRPAQVPPTPGGPQQGTGRQQRRQ